MVATAPPTPSPRREAVRNHAAFIWSVADLLRGDYKQSEYGKVILPLTVIRRLDCVLEPTKQAVLDEAQAARRARSRTSSRSSRRSPAQQFYNTSPLTFTKLLDDPEHDRRLPAALHRRASPRRPRTSSTSSTSTSRSTGCDRANLLYQVIGKFAEIDLHPEAVSNIEMGYLYEELIRRFSELSNETAGEHFTPREVIRLMVNLLFIEDDDVLTKPASSRRCATQPAAPAGCCPSPRTICASSTRRPPGGVRPGAERRDLRRLPLRHDAQGPGRLAHRASATRFTEDGHEGERFDYLLANPPFGVEWKKVEDEVRKEDETQGLQRPLRRRAAAHQRRLVPLPPAHDLQDEAARRRAARGWRSSSTARRCSPARPAPASPRSAAGSSRTTGSRPSSRCRTSSSTTPASRPTSGSSPTARPRSAAARSSSSTPASTS